MQDISKTETEINNVVGQSSIATSKLNECQNNKYELNIKRLMDLYE